MLRASPGVCEQDVVDTHKVAFGVGEPDHKSRGRSRDDLLMLGPKLPRNMCRTRSTPALSLVAFTWARNPQNLQMTSAHWKLAGA